MDYLTIKNLQIVTIFRVGVALQRYTFEAACAQNDKAKKQLEHIDLKYGTCCPGL